MHCHSVLVFVQWAVLKYLVILSGTLSKLFDWDTSKSKVAGILCRIKEISYFEPIHDMSRKQVTVSKSNICGGEIQQWGEIQPYLEPRSHFSHSLMLETEEIQHSAIDSSSWLMLENCCISSDTLDSLWLQLMRVPAPYKLALIYGLPPWAMQKCDTLPRWVHIWISNSDFGNISACPGCLWQLAIFC